MAKIDINEADQIAVEHLISALQSNFSAFLNDVRDSGLTLPAPSSNAFYAYLINPLELFGRDTTNRPNHGVTCFISDTDDRVIQNKRTGGPLFYVADSYIDIEISLAFIPDPNEAITKNSKTLDTREIARVRAKRYMEALRKCIYRHGCATSKIHHIDIIQSSNRIDVVDALEIGYARVKVRCTQQVKIPFPTTENTVAVPDATIIYKGSDASGSSVTDSSGNGYSAATLFNSPTIVDGVIQFRRSDSSYMEFGDAFAPLVDASNKFTVAIVFNAPELNSFTDILWAVNSAGGGNIFLFQYRLNQYIIAQQISASNSSMRSVVVTVDLDTGSIVLVENGFVCLNSSLSPSTFASDDRWLVSSELDGPTSPGNFSDINFREMRLIDDTITADEAVALSNDLLRIYDV